MELAIIEGISSGIFDGKAYVLLAESDMLRIDVDVTDLTIIYHLENLAAAAADMMYHYGYNHVPNEQTRLSQLTENIWMIKIKWVGTLNPNESGELGMHLVGLRQTKKPRFR